VTFPTVPRLAPVRVTPPDAGARIRLDRPFDLVRVCRALTDGGSDPTWQISASVVRRAMTTPDGAAALQVTGNGRVLEVRAWGPGSEWITARTPSMLGLHDDAEGFRPDLHPLVARMAARHPGLRFGASLRLWDAVIPTVLGQRVTVGEARRSWSRLVRRHGSPAPGQPDLLVPPSPATVSRLGVADWHVIGVERARADTIRRIIPVLPALERAAGVGSPEFQHRAVTVPGVGPWTATSLAATVFGDADAVLLGDLHLPHTVSWALAGEPRGSDARMLELLEPWSGHRARVVRLVKAAGRAAPRRGPRYRPLPIERW
jgi:3-methyladenine DNA glycosylase/8-oxoguanine DNA glycosylase